MPDAAEHVEGRRVARDRVGENLPGHSREHQAVPGKALHVVDVRADAAEVRRAVHGDVDETAPRIVDADIGELRENARDPIPHPVDQIARRRGVVAFSGAE